MADVEKQMCLVDPTQEATCRGLCRRCYQAAANAVKSGKVTWDQLVEQGLALPSTRSTGPNPFTQALIDKGLVKEQVEEASAQPLPWQDA